MKKQQCVFIVLWPMLIGLLFSCRADSDLSEDISEVTVWKQQLDLVKSSAPKVISKSLFINKSELTLLNYKHIGRIATKSEIEQLKAAMLSSNAYFPFYDVANSMIKIKTCKDISLTRGTDGITYSIKSLENCLDTTLRIGMEKVELEWMCGSEVFNTICVVSSQNGIVYDNIISNVLCINGKSRVVTKGTIPTTRSDPSSDMISYTWRLSDNCNWIWGSIRGEVELEYTIIGYPNDLQFRSYNARSWINTGNRDAQILELEFHKGMGGFSAFSYGYYLATPTVSLSLIVERGELKLSGETGIGSSLGKTGVEQLSSSNLVEEPKPKPEPGPEH